MSCIDLTIISIVEGEEVLCNYNCDHGEDEFEEFWNGACIEIIKASHRRRGRFISNE